jgi:hypothetical protein
VVKCKSYRERYQGMSGRDPLVCRYCGCEIDLRRVWHPKYGKIYDEWEKIKAGKYERAVESKDTATNEAIIDFELGYAEFEGREVIMPVLGCPGRNRETMKYTGTKSSPEGRKVHGIVKGGKYGAFRRTLS